MAKRESIESKIVAYFTSAPFETAMTISGIVKGIMKSRAEDNQPLPTGTAGTAKPRKARTKKSKVAGTGSGTGPSTSFLGAGVEAGNAA